MEKHICLPANQWLGSFVPQEWRRLRHRQHSRSGPLCPTRRVKPQRVSSVVTTRPANAGAILVKSSSNDRRSRARHGARWPACCGRPRARRSQAHFDQAFDFQRDERLAQRRPRDRELQHQFALGRQARADGVLAVADQRAQLIGNLAVEPEGSILCSGMGPGQVVRPLEPDRRFGIRHVCQCKPSGQANRQGAGLSVR